MPRTKINPSQWSKFVGDPTKLASSFQTWRRTWPRAWPKRWSDRSSSGSRTRDVARAGAAVFVVAGVRAIDLFVARRPNTSEAAVAGLLDDDKKARTITANTTIWRPVEDVYAFFRDYRNFPKFMAHLDQVESFGDGRSHWRLRILGGRAFDFDAEILEDRPNELLMWRSLPGADVDNIGVVRFSSAPGGHGTQIHVDLRYAAPAGRLGVLIASLFGFEPGQQARGDLRRLKQLLETGEILHSDSSIHELVHAAQPPAEEFIHDPAQAGEAA